MTFEVFLFQSVILVIACFPMLSIIMLLVLDENESMPDLLFSSIKFFDRPSICIYVCKISNVNGILLR